VTQISVYVILCGAAALTGSVLLYLYEGDWGEAYYRQQYGSGFFSDFWGMLGACRWGGILMILIGCTALFVARKLEHRKTPAEMH
jgi:hypothetical protein